MFADENSSGGLDALFNEAMFVEKQADWDSPEVVLSQKKLFEVLERRLEGLPKNTAPVFAMREVRGLDTDDICKKSGVRATNKPLPFR